MPLHAQVMSLSVRRGLWHTGEPVARLSGAAADHGVAVEVLLTIKASL